MSSIEPDLEHVVSQSPFLQKHAEDALESKGIALFRRHEIETGNLLGKGGFSYVLNVTAFNLDDEVSNSCNAVQQALREQYAASALTREGKSRYCIKHLQQRLISNPRDFQCAAADLAVEAAFMSSLDHPNILSLRALPFDGLSAWKDGKHDGYFIICDRLVGTLDKKVQKWRVSDNPTLDQKCEYALQLSYALKYLHENRIVFRDLKPHNIGFTASGKVMLFDFGLCRELPSKEVNVDGLYRMSGVGTRRYMAVEIINTGRYNRKADVYGWAMIFWEMLNLTKPFAPYSTDDHKREVCKGGERPPIDPAWPAWVETLLRMSWEESVRCRFSMQEAYDCLRTAMEHQRDTQLTELDVTLHDHSSSKSVNMPNSPTGTPDFHSIKFSQVAPIGHPEGMDDAVSPSSGHLAKPLACTPLPPKRATDFIKVPESAKREILMKASSEDELGE